MSNTENNKSPEAAPKLGVLTGSVTITFEDLQAALRQCIDGAADMASANTPDGYEELEGPALAVADACFDHGLEVMETAMLDWFYDRVNSQNDLGVTQRGENQ